MGMIAQALEAPSSYAAKKTDLWSDLMTRIEDCMFDNQVDAFVVWLDEFPLSYPPAWRESLDEIVAKKRDEIAEEDISKILRDRFDF